MSDGDNFMKERINSPELVVEKWLNTKENISLESLRGKVIAIYAFQMLCPACIEHSMPQARKVNALFGELGVQVLGLHTVFEHHAAMAEVSLRAFLHEYKLSFPIGIDRRSDNPKSPIPQTMSLYNMAGTPSLLLIDRRGMLRKHKMGHEDDLLLGAQLMSLLKEN